MKPLLAALIAAVFPVGVMGELTVWTVQGTVRLNRDAPAGAERSVRLSAARNEWESFQILLRTDQAVSGVNVEPADLVGPAGAILKADDAEVYRQHQLELSEPSYRNSAFKPGWYPDPLIPLRHPLTRRKLQGRFTAAPFDLPAQQTHGFFIDVHVPASAAPGEYRGTYRVTASGKSIDVPVVVQVWDFVLPATPSMITAFGSPAERMRGYYRQRAKEGKEPEPADWDAVEQQCSHLLSQHRFNATPPRLSPKLQPDGSFKIPAEEVASLRRFIDQYHVNAIQVPRPQNVIKAYPAEKPRLLAWLKAWDDAAKELGRDVLFYTYLLDEPNDPQAYEEVRTWGRAVREAKGVVKVMVVEQPQTQNPQWGDLYGAVDIWCPLFALFEPEPAAARQKLGETIWCYTALSQGKTPTPWWEIDFPLLNYRLPVWMMFRHRIDGLLYWGGMSHWKQVDDPWLDPKTYDKRVNGKGGLWNGEGTLVYPARAVGYDGIVPSLRLKALRDAIEDYEYLAMAQRQGQREAAMKVVDQVARSWTDWEADPGACERGRALLAAILTGAKR